MQLRLEQQLLLLLHLQLGLQLWLLSLQSQV